jgi:hypothetical protein
MHSLIRFDFPALYVRGLGAPSDIKAYQDHSERGDAPHLSSFSEVIVRFEYASFVLSASHLASPADYCTSYLRLAQYTDTVNAIRYCISERRGSTRAGSLTARDTSLAVMLSELNYNFATLFFPLIFPNNPFSIPSFPFSNTSAQPLRPKPATDSQVQPHLPQKRQCAHPPPASSICPTETFIPTPDSRRIILERYAARHGQGKG